MRVLREWIQRFWGTLRPGRRDSDLEEELRLHLELAAEDARQRCDAAADSIRVARLRVGGISQAMEALREQRGLPLLEDLARDLRHALRTLQHSPGFAAAALITTAIGVGGTTAVFSVIYGVLVRPLPYADSERLVRVWEVHPGANAPFTAAVLSQPTFDAWSRTRRSLQEIAAFRVSDYTVSGMGVTERLRGTKATPPLFRVLGVSPVAGRFFADADAQPGAAPVVVLAYVTWRDQFGSDPSAVGRVLTLDNVDHRIIGVAPAGVSFPEQTAGWSDSPRDIRLYTPFLPSDMKPSGTAIGLVEAIARLTPRSTIAYVEAEGTVIARSVDRPSADLVFGRGGAVEVRALSIVNQMTARVRPALIVLAVAVGLVLLIACANVANLFLSRGVDRTRELAVRAALGAGRRVLVRQLLTESLVISLAGGVLGVFVGWALTAAVPALAPRGFPRLDDIHVDLPFLIAAVLVALFIGIVSGVLPATKSSRVNLDVTLRGDGTRSVGTSSKGPRRMLLIIEAALAVVLLIGATLLARALIRVVNVDAGYDPRNVLTADLYVMGAADTTNARRTSQLTASMLERVRAMPGVLAAGAGNMVPFGGVLASSGFALPGMTTPDGRPVVARALQAIITPGYAEALGLRLKEGRFFRPEDPVSPIQPLIVNETFARTYFADGKAITGRRLSGLFPRVLGRSDAIFDVVGVVEDVRPAAPDAPAQAQIYLVHGGGFAMGGRASIVVKTERDPTALAATLRGVVQQVEPRATLDRVGPLTEKISSSLGEPRFAAFVVMMFSALALVLATTGLYGVLSYDVTQRRNEIGIRAALGAPRNKLLGMIVQEGLTATGIGLIIGVVAALAAARAMASLLYGMSPFDGVAFSVGPLLLFVVACVACLIPGRSAANADPAQALKAQ